MAQVSMNDLRNHMGDVLSRVQQGESLVVTSNGKPVAQLNPLPRATKTEDAIAECKNLPPMSYEALRRDLDAIINPDLFDVERLWRHVAETRPDADYQEELSAWDSEDFDPQDDK
jgi:prevent-host-death family protein